MQGLYDTLLDCIQTGNESRFRQVFSTRDFDCSGFIYDRSPLFNAIVSAICTLSPEEKREIEGLDSTRAPGYREAIAALEARVDGRDGIFNFLTEHLHLIRLINASDVKTGETPMQIALEANDLSLVNRLFIEGVQQNSKLEIEGVAHCNLFMKAIGCPKDGETSEAILRAVASGSTKKASSGGHSHPNIVSLAKNYEQSLLVLASSNAAGENIFHRIIKRKDGAALEWLKRILLSENPIVEEASRIVADLELPERLKEKILADARSCNASFVRKRERLCIADIILNAPCNGLDPTEFLLSEIATRDSLRFAGQVPIKNSNAAGYCLLGEIVDGFAQDEVEKVAHASVTHSQPIFRQAFFLAANDGDARLDQLCQTYIRADGRITHRGLVDFLIETDFP